MNRVRLRAVLLWLLIVANLALLLFGDNIRSLGTGSRKRTSEQRVEEYSQELDGLLEEEDYLGFNSFCEYHMLDTSEGGTYEEYWAVRLASGEFTEVYTSLARAVMPGSEDPQTAIGELASHLKTFYEQCAWGESENTKLAEAVPGMKRQVRQLIQTYADCEEEEVLTLERMDEDSLLSWLQEHI